MTKEERAARLRDAVAKAKDTLEKRIAYEVEKARLQETDEQFLRRVRPSLEDIERAGRSLLREGLIEAAGQRNGQTVYRLSSKGKLLTAKRGDKEQSH